jgi:predicted lactoylglutathione lyase
MIGYVTLGTNDIERGAKFYDALLATIGAQRIMDEETFIVWGTDWEKCSLSIIKPFDGNPATVGNGTMVSIAAANTEQVDALHAKALELGAQNEGDPGFRNGSFYTGYFRDLDGNKLNAFCVNSPDA